MNQRTIRKACREEGGAPARLERGEARKAVASGTRANARSSSRGAPASAPLDLTVGGLVGVDLPLLPSLSFCACAAAHGELTVECGR